MSSRGSPRAGWFARKGEEGFRSTIATRRSLSHDYLVMIFVLLLGIMVGIAAMLFPVYKARRSVEQAEEEKQQLSQERQLVVDFMHHMVEALGEGAKREELPQRIVHAAILCSGALSACLFQRGADGQMRSVAVEGLFPPHRPLSPVVREKLATRARFIEQVLKSESFPENEGIVGDVLRTGEGQLVADAAADPRVVRHDDPALKVRSVIAVPLKFNDQFFGVLAVANSADGEPFTQNDFSLMRSLGEQAALALHNAEILNFQLERKQLDLDLSLASGIQKMLLPRHTLQFRGIEIDARYQAAQKVSGDFYDIFPLSPTRLGVAVADVSGKGIPASLLMAICRTNLRQIAPRYDSPAAALSELNRVLANDIEQGTFITLLYAVIDTERDTATFARAGHELPLMMRDAAPGSDSGGDFLGSDGMPLGLVPDEVFSGVIRDVQTGFSSGDLLVLYTDGLTETPNDEGKEFAASRLADAVRASKGRPPKNVNDTIMESLQRFSGQPVQRDDLTLVTLKRIQTQGG